MIHDIEISKTVESNKVPFGRKVLNILSGTKMLEPFRPLCAMLPKINAYRKHFDETKYMLFFLIKNDELIEKYNEIWNKVSKVIKKGFDS